MQRPTVFLLLVAGLISGCQHAPTPEPQPAVTGTVTYRERMALGPECQVEVQLLDVSRADAPSLTLAKQVLPTEGRQPPYAFRLSYSPEQIIPNHTYAVSARITCGGELWFINDTRISVLTQGAPTEAVEVPVVRVRTGTP